VQARILLIVRQDELTGIRQIIHKAGGKKNKRNKPTNIKTGKPGDKKQANQANKQTGQANQQTRQSGRKQRNPG
ncbi:hypothetical protein LDENG_00082160, partial [Lucifuga dentata]